MAEQTCLDCGEVRPASEFHKDPSRATGTHPYCKRCRRERYLAAGRAKHFRTKYGLTEVRIAEMRETQGGRCLVCGLAPDELVVDHCHSSGAVRGLLCRTCNMGLGLLKDDPDVLRAAATYLELSRRESAA